jgi:putative oxidoreductase
MNFQLVNKIASLAIAVLISIMGISAIFHEPVTNWFAASSIAWIVLLCVSAIWMLGGSFHSLVATGLSTAIVGRLFSTVQLGAPSRIGSGAADLLLQVETGPGLPYFGLLSTILGILLLTQFISIAVSAVRASKGDRQPIIQIWTLTFIRIYVGLMFIPHFVGHILAGPHQFEIYTQYFAGLHMPAPAIQLVLAGIAEFVTTVGLAFGLGTRLVALLGAAYLFLTMLLGGHFSIGYVWILPNGGYEFGIFWSVIVGLFMIIGGGPISLDAAIKGRLYRSGVTYTGLRSLQSLLRTQGAFADVSYMRTRR